MTKFTTIIAAAAVMAGMASAPVSAQWGSPWGNNAANPGQYQAGAGGPQGMAPGRYPGNAATGNYGQPPRMPMPQYGNPNVAQPGYGYGMPPAARSGMYGR
jgi:hypothetical protein